MTTIFIDNEPLFLEGPPGAFVPLAEVDALEARIAALQAEVARLWAVYQEVYSFLETEGFLNMGPHPPTPYEKKVSELENKLIILFNEKAVGEE